MKIRTLLLTILASSICLSAISCGSSGGGDPSLTGADTGTPGSENTEPAVTELTDNLPEGLDFNGETLKLQSVTYHPKYSQLFVADQDGELLNDTRFAAERAVEERLNLVLEEDLGSKSVDSFDAQMKSMILAGDNTYSMFTNMDRFMIADTLEGMFWATSDLPYVDLSARYWNSEATNNFALSGKTYFTMSSFSLYSYKNTAGIFMNLDLAESLGIGKLYDDVYAGKWTTEYMMTHAAKGLADLNGDGVYDGTDQYGYGLDTHPKNTVVNYIVGSGCYDDVLVKNKEGLFEYSISKKFYELMEFNWRFAHETDFALIKENQYPFINGTILFCEGPLDKLENAYRDVEFNFSVLPIPKYDEAQDSYYSRTFDSHFTMIPVTRTELEICGAVLEALSCEAYRNILPAYIEDSLKTKYTRDVESQEMLQLILDTRITFVAEAFMFNTYGNHNLWSVCVNPSSLNVVSALDAMENTVRANIDKFNAFFGA
ncbi:MAG: hypothetical protein GX628_05315 [Clostridiales bacterium]|nr:hypothetical protein [Clostridiales bacterium]